MKKHLLLTTFLLVLLTVFHGCRYDDDREVIEVISYEAALQRVMAFNVQNMGIALNSVYIDLVTDSASRAEYAGAFLRDIRFLPENNGYFFLESLSGYNIIDAAYPAIEGTYRLDQTTPDGYYYVQAMVDKARYAGVGWVNYYFDNPATGNLEKKSTFIKDMPDAGWYLGSGFYTSDLAAGHSMTPAEFNDFSFQVYVHTMAQGLAGVAGHYAGDPEFVLNACRNMVHHIHFNTDGSGYYFIYNMDGVVMAHGATPSLEGEDLYNYTDAKGNKVIQLLIEKVRTEGEGFVDYYWEDPATQQVEAKRACVEKIAGTDWFVGSGFYHQ